MGDVKADKELVGKAKKQKKSTLETIASKFFADSLKHVGDYVWNEVAIPGLKGIVADIASRGISMWLYGDGSTSSSSSVKSSSATTYHNAFVTQNGRKVQSVSVNKGYSYDSLIVSTRAEGEKILTKLGQILAEVGCVTVADMYDLVGEVHNWTDNKYGWTDLRGAKVTLAREGYLVKLPDPQPIN